MKLITLLIICILLLPWQPARSDNGTDDTHPFLSAIQTNKNLSSEKKSEDGEKPFSFYPIPAHEELHIKYNLPAPSEIDVLIRNSIGAEMADLRHYTNEKSGILTIDTSKFATGIYFIEVNSAGFNEFKKIIII